MECLQFTKAEHGACKIKGFTVKSVNPFIVLKNRFYFLATALDEVLLLSNHFNIKGITAANEVMNAKIRLEISS